jgi:hypothetical protein
LPDEQFFHPVYSIAEALVISHSTILSCLRKSLDMNFFHLRCILHELKTSLEQIRMETCRELLSILKAHEKNKNQRFVTGSENWFTLKFYYSTKWRVSRGDVPQKVKQQIGTQKFMLTVLWGIDGFRVVDLMTEQHSCNTQYFLTQILEPLLLAVFPDGVRCDSKTVRFDFEIVLYDTEIVPFEFKSVRYDVEIVHYDRENTVSSFFPENSDPSQIPSS